MAPELRSLFSPVQVGRLTLKNRIYSSGHAEAMAESGRPGDRLTRYHEAKARGGCALTIFGGSSSVHPSSPAAAWKQIANHDDSIIPAYRALADAVCAGTWPRRPRFWRLRWALDVNRRRIRDPLRRNRHGAAQDAVERAVDAARGAAHCLRDSQLPPQEARYA